MEMDMGVFSHIDLLSYGIFDIHMCYKYLFLALTK